MANSIFVKVGEQCYETDQAHMNKFLTGVTERAQGEQVAFDPNTQGFVNKGPICDITQLNAERARSLIDRLKSSNSV